jgi:tellurite resistance protein
MSKQAEAELTKLLVDIFKDNVVTVAERTSLLELRASGALSEEAIQRVFAAFVEKKWGEALADGVVTEQEKLLLRRILEELELPPEKIPLQLRLAHSR